LSKFVLVLSDLHTGGAFGLMPPETTLSTGSVHQLNVGQQYLWHCWTDMLDKLPERIDLLIINGDAVDGPNKAEAGRGVNEPDPLWQAKHAAKMLKYQLVDKSAQIVMTTGSKYHVGYGNETEIHLASLLNVDPPETWIHKEHEGKFYLDIAHRQSFGKRSRTASLETEIGYLLERKARARELLPEQTILIRSHTHSGYRSVDEQGILAITTPSWKIQDAFAKGSANPNRLYPDNLGAIGLRLYDEPVDGSLVQVVKYLYPHPKMS